MKFDCAILLGFTVPDAFAKQLFEADPRPAVQTHNFAWSVADVLGGVFEQVVLISAPPVQPFPITPFRSFPWQKFVERNQEGFILGGRNGQFTRHPARFLACLQMTRQLRRDWSPDIVFVHGVHSPFLAYATILRRLGIKVIVILTDPPGVVLSTDGLLRRKLKTIDRWLVKKLLCRMTAIIALAPKLAEELAPNLPRLVFPGIVSEDWLRRVSSKCRTSTNLRLTVTSAGGVEVSYGASLLVGAAEKLPEVAFRICGKGSYLEEARAKKLQNLTLPGFLSRDTVAEEVMAADILINPRPTNSALSGLSFPSKLLEYLATGRPVLTTRIPGIPSELEDCFFYIEEETPDGVAAAVNRVAQLDTVERIRFGNTARERVLGLLRSDALARNLSRFLAPF